MVIRPVEGPAISWSRDPKEAFFPMKILSALMKMTSGLMAAPAPILRVRRGIAWLYVVINNSNEVQIRSRIESTLYEPEQFLIACQTHLGSS
jgi:hypothetical protein